MLKVTQISAHIIPPASKQLETIDLLETIFNLIGGLYKHVQT